MEDQKSQSPAGGPPKPGRREYYLFAFKIMGDFGVSIAVPAVLGALLGQYLDGRYHKYPLFTVLCLVTAFLITVKIIKKKSQMYGEEYKKLNDAASGKS